MLTKAFWITALFISGGLLINLLLTFEVQALKELFLAIIIAMILQPWVMRQFE